MPGQHYDRKTGLKRPAPRELPHPGIGGYDYPRGPFGATGFPGSTPAALHTPQDAEHRKDRQLTATQIRARDTGPEFGTDEPWRVPKPQPPASRRGPVRPGVSPRAGNTYVLPDGSPRLPTGRLMRGTRPEHRMTPIIGGLGLAQRAEPRNQIAQRWKAIPGQLHDYRPSPNPGKTGARLTGPSQYHPDTTIHGEPDGKPIPGMPSQPGDPKVTVPSRYVSPEGAQEGYAMNRQMLFAKGGTPAPIPPGAAPHIRGGRLSGQRYFGDIADQQRIGLPSDSYGIARARGPRHRPVNFVRPGPWSANYYDVAPDEGTQSPDMIHRSARTRTRGRSVRRG